ncbi:MAG TPA: dienelactone hydrolase family protein [Candidatus Methylomirabilis sp.]|nr:dienelactone hydrolase family protein [Candidatus Methylomirabilis sp.]
MANKTLEYRDGAVTLKGYLADDGRAGARPGVVLFPEAFGIGEHVMERARRLAALGYVALAADPYGDGAQASDLPHAIELMTAVRSDVTRWRARAQSALDAVSAQPGVDRAKLAAIGYCFGGSTALELGRSGAALKAIVSFHGGLEAPKPEDAKNIRAKVLVCHGAGDPLVPPEQVAAFETQMRATAVDWQVVSYGGAVHSFTNPDAGKLGNPALAYNPAADRRSWAAMLALFGEAFA